MVSKKLKVRVCPHIVALGILFNWTESTRLIYFKVFELLVSWVMEIFLMIVAGHEANLPAMHGDGNAACSPTSSQSHSWSVDAEQSWCRQHQSSQKVQRQGQELVIPRPALKDCRVTRAVRLLWYCQYHHQCLFENKILPWILNCSALEIIMNYYFNFSAKNRYQLLILYVSLKFLAVCFSTLFCTVDFFVFSVSLVVLLFLLPWLSTSNFDCSHMTCRSDINCQPNYMSPQAPCSIIKCPQIDIINERNLKLYLHEKGEKSGFLHYLSLMPMSTL
jgi:hypothetical protein